MGEEIESIENHDDSTQKNPNFPEIDDNDEQVLNFMDSLDSYISLIISLSSTLRQGWFDLASARYSMGASRVNGALLNLKEHPAATYVEVSSGEEPNFTLCKWASADAEDSTESKDRDSRLTDISSIRQRHKEEAEEDSSPVDGPLVNTVDRVQKERVKSLAVFGTLVSPKLRSSQSSFETAVETLVEIANTRASMLSSYDKVRRDLVDVDGVKK